ncbi:MAG: 50S ribosomal protein L18 [Candidatus Colwellbacteria bacterium]|nr:50S ribosomal protein L18 [Candidatus Colwellbacteria bacterium]
MKRLTPKKRRAIRNRVRVRGTKEAPRLSVFRSNKYIYAQLINDEDNKTVVSASSVQLGKKKGTKKEQAESLGKLLAKSAIEAGIKKARFDRGAYKYHGRVMALAEGARKEGLKI